jgi:hypothetical protein
MSLTVIFIAISRSVCYMNWMKPYVKGPYRTRPPLERFWEKIKRGSPDSCWEWQWNTGNHGYGQFHYKRTPHLSHRMAYEFTYGEIPSGAYVLHTCDNRRCCNPNHLYLGSQLDNGEDASLRQRYPYRKGEKNQKSKLTNAQVLEIIRATGERGSLVKLARKFKVSVTTLYSIRTEPRRWAHLKQDHVIA